MGFNYFLECLLESFSFVDTASQEIGYSNKEVQTYCKNLTQYEINLNEFFKSHKDELGFISLMPISNEVYSVDRFGDLAYHIRAFANSDDIEISTHKGSITDRNEIEKFRQLVLEYSKFLDKLLEILKDTDSEFNLDENKSD